MFEVLNTFYNGLENKNELEFKTRIKKDENG